MAAMSRACHAPAWDNVDNRIGKTTALGVMMLLVGMKLWRLFWQRAPLHRLRSLSKSRNRMVDCRKGDKYYGP
jgi:hypothetical protein